MKKRILSIVLSLVLIIGASPMVFAETADTEKTKAELTEQQKSDRKAFLEVYNDQKGTFDQVKADEKYWIKQNNEISKEIRTIIRENYKGKVEGVKTAGEQVRELVKEAKELNQERLKLKAKGKKTAEDLTTIVNKNKDIKSIRDQIASIISKHKQDREALKEVKRSLAEEKGLGRLIQQAKSEKQKYEEEFKTDLEKSDYKEASKDFSKIIEKRNEIVTLLKARYDKLKAIKDDLNSHLNK